MLFPSIYLWFRRGIRTQCDFCLLRFGEKYTLIITTADQCRREDLICLIKEIFPGSIEKNTHSTCLLWDIAKRKNDR